MAKIFLTGPVGIGKSTVIDRALEALPFRAGGIRTRRVDLGDGRYTYLLTDVISGERYEFARSGPGGLEVYPGVFETAGVRALQRSRESADVVILDELGRMELDASGFRGEVLRTLDGPGRVLGVVKPESNPFLDAVRAHSGVEVLEVTEDNRDSLVAAVAGRMKNGPGPAATGISGREGDPRT